MGIEARGSKAAEAGRPLGGGRAAGAAPSQCQVEQLPDRPIGITGEPRMMHDDMGLKMMMRLVLSDE